MNIKIRIIRAGKQTRKIFAAAMLVIYLIIPFCVIVSAEGGNEGTGKAVFAIEQIFTNTAGLSVPPNNIFNYILTPDKPNNPMPAGSNANGYAFTITGTANRQINITFIETGIYVYELRHTTSSRTGYIYDPKVYVIEIYVTNDLKYTVVAYNKINDTQKTKTQTIGYNHTYKMLPTDPDAMADPYVVKTVAGNPPAPGTFTFRLAAENPSNPMPSGSVNGVKTITITGSNRSNFGAWVYYEAGIYYYTITEFDSGGNYRYDTAVYTITDTVTAVGNQLELTRVITNKARNPVTSLSFINTYTGSIQPPTLPPAVTQPPAQPTTARITGNPPPITDPPTLPPAVTQPPAQPPAQPSTQPIVEPPAQPQTEPVITPPTEYSTQPPTITPPTTESTITPSGGTVPSATNTAPPPRGTVPAAANPIPPLKYQPVTYGPEPTDRYTPPGKTPPQTGDESQTRLYFIMLCAASTAAMGSTGYLLTNKVRKGKGEEK